MSCIISQENLEKVKKIEKAAYPAKFHTYQDVATVADAYDEIDCSGDFFCHIGEDWYILGCNDPDEVEIHDMASASRNLGFKELNIVLELLRKFGEKTISADCRDSTSYQLLKLAEKRGRIEVMKEIEYLHPIFREKMHNVKFKVLSPNFKEWLEKFEKTFIERIDIGTKNSLEKINPRIFPDREQLNKLIRQMEEDPQMISRKDAFDRINAVTGVDSSQKTLNRMDSTIQKANQIKQPNEVLKSLQQDYLNKKLSNPELLSLTYMSSIGVSDNEVKELARFIKDELTPGARRRITFPVNKPKLIMKNGVVEISNPIDFSTGLHALPGIEQEGAAQEQDQEEKQGPQYFDPETDVRPERHDDLLIAKNGIYIYRGSNPMKCREYGKGTNLCISSSTSTFYYFTYRHDYKQTQYFIYDTNKNNKARIVNPGVAEPGGYSEWVDAHGPGSNHAVRQSDGNGFGIEGYSSIEDYKNYLTRMLGISMEQLDEILKPTPITPEEEKLKKYLEDYKNAS